MGLFGKSQPKETKSITSSYTNIQKSTEKLDKTVFWGIIDKSLQSTNNQQDQENFLVSEIEELTPKEIIGFRLRTDKLLYDTIWCAD